MNKFYNYNSSSHQVLLNLKVKPQDLRYVIGNMLNTLITKLCFYSGSLHNIP
ncbi:MAG: hypothetical protein LN546_05270 [Rickettsia endosymbiont of Ecitomorpha arachnoides]|nr:hypothetical protein [Rickettsia endosymbiont of Ecitomorpha arachnoides]